MVMFYLFVQAEVAEGIGSQCVPIVVQSRGGKKGDTDCTLPMSWDHLGTQGGGGEGKCFISVPTFKISICKQK